MNSPSNPQSAPENTLLAIRSKFLQGALYIVALFTLIGAGISFPRIIQSQQWIFIPALGLVIAIVLGITFYRKLTYTLRSSILLIIIFGLSLVGLLVPELTFDGRVALLAFVSLANFLQGSSTGIVSTVFSSVIVILFAWASSSAPINNFSAHFTSGNLEWLGTWVTFAFSATITTISFSFLQNGMLGRLENLAKLNRQLVRQAETLESQSQEQSKFVNQSAAQLSTCWSVSGQFRNTENATDALNKIAEIAKTNFNFTYVGIFLIDEKRENALLKFATGDVGRTLIESNYRVNVHENAIISQVVEKSEASIIPDTENSQIFNPTPLMAGTRSQAVFPIMKGKLVIGALDVQSSSVHDFSAEELRSLDWMTNQIGMVLEIVNLENLIGNLNNEVNGIYRQMTQQNWRTHLKQSRRVYSYRYKQSSLEKNVPESAETAQVFKSGEPILDTGQAFQVGGQVYTTVAIPIKLRNQVLGVLNFKLNANHLPQDMIPVLEAASNRLAVALENARLLEEIQSKANREHLVGEISSKIRNSTNVDQVLRTTATELGRTLGISEVLVQLRPSEPN